MKNTNLYGLLICSAAMLINSGCTEETLATDSPIYTVPLPDTVPPKDTVTPPVATSPPTAYAGADFQVILPTDFCWLSGGYSDTETIDNFVWKKISGPSSYILENPDSLRTKLSKLEKGIYEFELTVTNKKGLAGKDISRVIVGEMSANPKEIIFKDVVWSCDWDWNYCELRIENIYTHLLSDSVFRIYVQRDNSIDWEEAVYEYSASVQYIYTLYNGHLYISANDYSEMNETPNIKIVY